MVWIPARAIADVVRAAAPGAIDPRAHPTRTQGYLREFFEAVIRVRARDARLTVREEAVLLVACYDEMSPAAVFGSLSAFNRTLEPGDRERNPPETHGVAQEWGPLMLTRQYVDAATDALVFAEMVCAYSSSLAELRAAREVVEAAIAVDCEDARRAYLRDKERAALRRLARGGPESLLHGYRCMNENIARLGLDRRIEFHPLAGSSNESGETG